MQIKIGPQGSWWECLDLRRGLIVWRSWRSIYLRSYTFVRCAHANSQGYNECVVFWIGEKVKKCHAYMVVFHGWSLKKITSWHDMPDQSFVGKAILRFNVLKSSPNSESMVIAIVLTILIFGHPHSFRGGSSLMLHAICWDKHIIASVTKAHKLLSAKCYSGYHQGSSELI